MQENKTTRIPEIIKKSEKRLLDEWLREQLNDPTLRLDLMPERLLREQSNDFVSLIQEAATAGSLLNILSPEWTAVRQFLSGLSKSRATLGFSATETATFVFSFKQPLFVVLGEELGSDSSAFPEEVRAATLMLDSLGLYCIESYIKSREEIIKRQQNELLELSTPVVKLWDGILALPLIGTLDSVRTQVVMESLLNRIVETGSTVAIIDITGVPMVDTLVAQHLLKTVAATRLMGADCIISGIRPQIAQTIISLGLNLSEVVTKATMADAFQLALKQMGLVVSKPRS